MCPEVENGNYPAAPEPHPPEGAETSSDPAALPAAEEAIDSEINESARVAADAPIPETSDSIPPRGRHTPER
jgi:hypothetical protein